MMENNVAVVPANSGIDWGTLEKVVIQGDLAQLAPQDRIAYYRTVCTSLGLNPATQPFEYIKLNNKLTLYAKKDATEQLRRIHNVSLRIVGRERIEDVYVVTAQATMPNGRVDESTGAVTLARLTGEALANAFMKAECVPLDSEILTRDGFKRHDELSIGEEVLAYDLETDTTIWTPLLTVRRYENAPVVRMRSDGGQFDVVCTPDHKWAVANQGYKMRSQNPRGPYANRAAERVLVEAHALNTGQRIILSAPEVTTTDQESPLTPVEAAILGWAVTDGTIKRVGNSVRLGICQSKEDNFPAIRELVFTAGGDVREFVSEPRTRTFPTGRTYDTKEQHWWYIPTAISKAILERAGFHDKSDLPVLVTRLSSPARKAMLQAFMLAEGDKRGIFANSNRGVLDAFTILCALEGIATGREAPKDTIATICSKKTRHVARSFLTVTDDGIADVWCPQTAYGTWIMRQNGRVMVTGNTKAKRRVTLSICGLGMLDESETETIPGAVIQPFAQEQETLIGMSRTKEKRQVEEAPAPPKPAQTPPENVTQPSPDERVLTTDEHTKLMKAAADNNLIWPRVQATIQEHYGKPSYELTVQQGRQMYHWMKENRLVVDEPQQAMSLEEPEPSPVEIELWKEIDAAELMPTDAELGL